MLSRRSLDVLQQKLIRFVGTEGGKFDGSLSEFIVVASSQVVVVVGGTLPADPQITSTDSHTHALTKAANKPHLCVDVIFGVMKEGALSNGLGPTAIGVGALEKVVVFAVGSNFAIRMNVKASYRMRKSRGGEEGLTFWRHLRAACKARDTFDFEELFTSHPINEFDRNFTIFLDLIPRVFHPKENE